MDYTKMSDRLSAKWYAYLVIGLAYRELGKYKEAFEALAQADRLADAAYQAATKDSASSATAVAQAKAAQALRIRIAYERPLTFLRRGDFKQAREAADEAAKFWKDKLDTVVLGQAIPVVKAESLILEAKEKNDDAMKQEGVRILQQLYTRPAPWPMVVQWMMEGLLGTGGPGAEVAVDPNADPFQIWIKATDALDRAQKTKESKDCEVALRLFKLYGDKVGAKDKNYATALYSQAACLLQLGRKGEAAALFQKVADEFPDYQYAKAAARYAVNARGDAYERDAIEENRQAYEDTLRWFIGKYLKEDPEQQYYYAMILFRGKKLVEAADAFGRVPEGTEHYPDARYWVPLCHLEQFREKILASKDKSLILTRSRTVAQELLSFADYALQAKGLPEEKKKQLRDWAEAAYVNAADIYLYPEVELPGDALPVLDALELKFTLDDDARGRVLKLRIDALQKLGQQDEALAVLEKFLKIAKKEDVGPVLRGLFKAITDEVRELVKRGDKESLAMAARKVDQAKALGERLSRWLDENNVADKALQIANNRYDLAELFQAVGNYSGALDIYKEIGGPQPEKPGKDASGNELPIKLDCVYGMARAYEGLGDKTRLESEAAGQAEAPETKQAYERAFELWVILKDIAEGDRQGDIGTIWDRRYHVFYSSYRLGKGQEVSDALETLRKIVYPEALGGKDPILQKRFRDLRDVLPAPETKPAGK
jgi:tetratricopeptide (TPR) repeat protein